MWPFKKDEENKESTTEAELGKTIRNLTDQIAALQQQLADSKKQIEQANEQAQEAQAKQQMAEKSSQAQGESVTATQGVLRDTQAQVSKLEKQLGELAQAKQQAEAAAAAAQAQAAQAAQAQTAPAATQDAPAQSQPASGGGSVLAAPTADAGAVGGLAAGGTAWVQRAGGKNLRLRNAPGLNSEVLGAISPGTQLSLHEGPQDVDGYSWWHITTQDGREGWVAGEELVTHPE